VSYWVEGKDGRKEFAMQSFARDVAFHIGGKYVLPEGDDRSVNASYAHVELEGGLRLNISKSWETRGTDMVAVGIEAADVKSLGYVQGDDYKTPRAKVSSSRPIEKIAADIKRRVIEPSAAPIAKLRALLAQRNESAVNLTKAAAALRKEFPSLKVEVKDGESYNGSVWNQGHYLSGSLYADGSVSISHIGSLSAEKFRRVMKALED